jgi:hypothetical protein
MKLGKKSTKNLIGLNPSLVIFCHELMRTMVRNKKIGLPYTDFSVTEGLRTFKKQKKNIKKGVSWTLNSKHLDGNAVDIVVYIKGVGVTWNDKKYKKEWDCLLTNARKVLIELGFTHIQNGFDLWRKDKPHFQITNNKISSIEVLKKYVCESR